VAQAGAAAEAASELYIVSPEIPGKFPEIHACRKNSPAQRLARSPSKKILNHTLYSEVATPYWAYGSTNPQSETLAGSYLG
jgi:hypothetical protein